jgi:hypothetical protein
MLKADNWANFLIIYCQDHADNQMQFDRQYLILLQTAEEIAENRTQIKCDCQQANKH